VRWRGGRGVDHAGNVEVDGSDWMGITRVNVIGSVTIWPGVQLHRQPHSKDNSR